MSFATLALPLFLLLAPPEDPMAAVRGLPCRTYEEQQAIVKTVRQSPMTAETYGVVLNLVAPRPEFFLESSLPDGWSYMKGDDFYAAQAFIVELSPRNETTGAFTITEALPITSSMLYDLEKMIVQMRGDPFPYTAFLALAHRIDNERNTGGGCFIGHDAARLVQVLDEPLIGREPDLSTTEACTAWLDRLHEWLQSHERELAEGAAKERPRVEAARARMLSVTLCRH